MATPSFDIKRLMDSAKNSQKSQKTKNNLNLLTQGGGMTPEAAARALVERRGQIDRFVDSILFG